MIRSIDICNDICILTHIHVNIKPDILFVDIDSVPSDMTPQYAACHFRLLFAQGNFIETSKRNLKINSGISPECQMVKIGNVQEMAQSVQKPRWEKNKLMVSRYTKRTCRKPNK